MKTTDARLPTALTLVAAATLACGPTNPEDGDGSGDGTTSIGSDGTTSIGGDDVAPEEDSTGVTSSMPDPDSSTGAPPPDSPWPPGEGPPDEGWFPFVGTAADNDGPLDCLYRWEPGQPPIELSCWGDDGTGAAEFIRRVAAPASGHRTVFVAVEELVLDVYPITIYAVDPMTGETNEVVSWDADPNGGPAEPLEHMLALDDDCVALQTGHQTPDGQPYSDVAIHCVSGGGSSDVISGAGSETLVSVVTPDRLLIDAELSALLLVDLTFGRAVAVTEQDVRSIDYDHDQEGDNPRVVYAAPGELAESRVHLFDGFDTITLDDTFNPAVAVAFTPEGQIFVGDATPTLWDGTEAAPVAVVGEGHLGYVGFVDVPDAIAFRAIVTDTTSAIAFVSGGHISDPCGEGQGLGQPMSIRDSTEMIAVYPAGGAGDDPSPRQLYACRPNAEPTPLLEAWGLRGTTLPASGNALQ